MCECATLIKFHIFFSTNTWCISWRKIKIKRSSIMFYFPMRRFSILLSKKGTKIEDHVITPPSPQTCKYKLKYREIDVQRICVKKSFTTFVRPFNIESSFLLLLKYIAKCGIGYTNPIGSHQFAQYIRRRRILAITLKEVIKTMKQMPRQVNVYFNTKAHILHNLNMH